MTFMRRFQRTGLHRLRNIQLKWLQRLYVWFIIHFIYCFISDIFQLIEIDLLFYDKFNLILISIILFQQFFIFWSIFVQYNTIFLLCIDDIYCFRFRDEIIFDIFC